MTTKDSLTLDDIAPDCATYHPGQAAQITIALTNRQAVEVQGRLVLRLIWLDQVVGQSEQDIVVGPGATVLVVFALALPSAAPRGYGLDATLYDGAGRAQALGSGALEVLEHWSQAPRYGFLSDFAPDQTDVLARCDALCRYHLNVVQFYD